MSGPWWLSGGLAVVMLAIAAYCAVRPAVARRWHRSTERDVDAAHVLMGVVMAATLVPRLNPIRGNAWAASCVTAFAVASAWFAIRSLRDWRHRSFAGRTDRQGKRLPGTDGSHHLIHLLSCGSMIYMLLAVASGAAAAAGAAAITHGAVSQATTGPIVAGTAVAGSTVAGSAMGATAATGAAAPLIALVLAVAMAGSVVVTIDRLAALAPIRPGRPAHGQPARGQPAHGQQATGQTAVASYGVPVLCPRVAASCQIAMGITMVFMLVQLF